MRRVLPLLLVGLVPLGTLQPQEKKQPDWPQGEKIQFAFGDSKVFPGTTRNVTVYVPKQYDGEKPA